MASVYSPDVSSRRRPREVVAITNAIPSGVSPIFPIRGKIRSSRRARDWISASSSSGRSAVVSRTGRSARPSSASTSVRIGGSGSAGKTSGSALISGNRSRPGSARSGPGNSGRVRSWRSANEAAIRSGHMISSCLSSFANSSSATSTSRSNPSIRSPAAAGPDSARWASNKSARRPRRTEGPSSSGASEVSAGLSDSGNRRWSVEEPPAGRTRRFRLRIVAIRVGDTGS